MRKKSLLLAMALVMMVGAPAFGFQLKLSTGMNWVIFPASTKIEIMEVLGEGEFALFNRVSGEWEFLDLVSTLYPDNIYAFVPRTNSVVTFEQKEENCTYKTSLIKREDLIALSLGVLENLLPPHEDGMVYRIGCACTKSMVTIDAIKPNQSSEEYIAIILPNRNGLLAEVHSFGTASGVLTDRQLFGIIIKNK